MTVRPPEDSPGSLSAIGNDKALHMEGFFASCGPPPARNELRGESSTRAHPNHRTCLTETGARMPPPARHQPSRQGSPQPEYPGPRFRPGILSPPLRAYHEAATAGQPYESLRHRCPVSPNTPSLPDIRTRRSSARRASHPAACLQPFSRGSPTDPPLHRRKAPSHTSRGIPAARKQARARKNSGIFSPQFSPSLLFPAP